VRADERTYGRTHVTNLIFVSRSLSDDQINLPLVIKKSTHAYHGFSAPREHRQIFGIPCSNKISSLSIVASGVNV